MTAVNLPTFFPILSDEEAWRIVNMMPVKYEDFAFISHLYSRAYDVLTGALEGGTSDGNRVPQGVSWDDIRVNNCLREAIYRTLWDVTQTTELRAGFNLSTRYHYVEENYPVGGKAITFWPGVSALNVKPVVGDIAGYSPVAVNYHIQENLTLDEPDVDTLTAAFDLSLNPNPSDVFIRKDGTEGVVLIEIDKTSYPRRVGTDWVVALNKKYAAVTDTLNAQNKKIVIVDAPTPTEGTDYPTGMTWWPVYPGTEQQIPVAKAPSDNGDGTTRWTFYIYTLVDPAFAYEKVDLIKGEFWKMLQEVEFKYFGEEEADFEVAWVVADQEAIVNPGTKLVDPAHGIFHIRVADVVCADPCDLFTAEDENELGCDCPPYNLAPESFKIRYWYKTDPSALDERYKMQVSGLRQAICYKVAADLPVKDCGCYLEVGFIAEQQTMLTPQSINPYTGIQVQNFDLGKTLGRLRYDHVMQETLVPYSRPIFSSRG